MKEQREIIETILIHAMCECGGEFLPTGEIYASNPPLLKHVCDRCGKQENFRRQYPWIDYCRID